MTFACVSVRGVQYECTVQVGGLLRVRKQTTGFSVVFFIPPTMSLKKVCLSSTYDTNDTDTALSGDVGGPGGRTIHVEIIFLIFQDVEMYID